MCHNDGDPTNDHLDNLRWDTHAANMQDAADHGITRRIQSGTAEKIENEAFVNAVMIIQKTLGMTQMEFAEYIGVDQSCLCKFYLKGPKDNIVIKVLRKYPYLAYRFAEEAT
jgi:hypothetical protein